MAEGENKNHYAYLSDSSNEDLGDTFYRNNEFLKCEAKNLCKKKEEVTRLDPLKKYAFFFRREQDGYIVPIFLQCYKSGTSTASMAEDLVPYVNEEVLEKPDCVDEDSVENSVNPSFVDDALKAIKSYENGCPKREDGECFKEIVDNVFDDLRNFTNPMNFFSGKKFEAGCFSNILTNAVVSVWETIKLFFYQIPRGIWNLGVSAWNQFFGNEEETSDALLTSSVMGEDMANAITSMDIPKVYELMKKNFWSFFKNIKEYYLELIGCTEWEGAPYYSTCLKKQNWSCLNCSNTLNFACGVVSQLGAGAFLGAATGLARSAAMMAKVRKAPYGNPLTSAMPDSALKEMAAKTFISNTLGKTGSKRRRAAFEASRKTRPLTNWLNKFKEDIKYVAGVGDSFRGLVEATPFISYYNGIFQTSKKWTFDRLNQSQFRKIDGGPLKKAHAYALRLDTIREKFDNLFVDYAKLRGANFDPVLFNKLNKEMLDTITDQLQGTGITVQRLPNQAGLALTKNGERFTYKPNFREYLDPRSPNAKSSLSSEDLKHLMSDRDFLLSNNPAITQSPRAPSFIKEMQEQATTARGIFKADPDAMDGYIYLANFSQNTGNIPKVEDCSGKMNGVKLIRMQDITDYPSEEEKTELLKEEREKEKVEAAAAKAAEEEARAAEEAAAAIAPVEPTAGPQ